MGPCSRLYFHSVYQSRGCIRQAGRVEVPVQHRNFSARGHLAICRLNPLMGMSSFCRVLYVRNLPFNISSEEMHDIFGKFGAIRQIRL